MARRSLAPLLALAALGCKETVPTATQTGLRLAVEYESSLDVDAFTVLLVDEAGMPMEEPIAVAAPVFLEPPGIRLASVIVETPGIEGMIGLRVDGLSNEIIVGSGWTEATIEPAKVVDATVRLGTPNACGDGRVHATLERCDDGNVDRGDGCSELCLPEVGYVCRGAPSVCVECGNGQLEFGETCDDGNRSNGDGCNASCEAEPNDAIHVIETECLDAFASEADGFVAHPDCTLAFTPGGSDEAWLVFASGSVGSDLDVEASAEVRVMLGDVERDRFGHQTLGAADNGAGFMTFFVVRADGEQRVTIELDGKGAIAQLRDVRLVAARLPEGADLQEVERQEAVEATGAGMALATLELAPATEGDYIVLARANGSEGPGGDTARTWVVGPNGDRHPNAPSGVGYSNGRTPHAPMFVAFESRVNGDAKISIEGTSSGVGEVDGWWDTNYRYRRALLVDLANVPEGTPTQVVFSHAAAVQAGRSRADGNDVRIVASLPDRQVELTRVLDPQSAWNSDSTHLWIAYANLLARQATIHMYYGYAGADAPPEDPANVFTFFDAFDDLDGWSAFSGAPTNDGNGRIRVPAQTGIRSTQTFDAANPMLFEARLRFVDPPQTGTAMYWGLGVPEIAGPGPAGFFTEAGAHYVIGGANDQSPWNPAAVDQYQIYRIAFANSGFIAFGQNDDFIGEFQGNTQILTEVHMRVSNQTPQDILLDWARVRPAVDPDPVASLGPVAGFAGLAGSTWTNLRIVAFRADAFERVQSASNPDLATTTSTFTQVVTELETEAAGRRAEYLVIQSARIGGVSSDTGRKIGVLLADGASMLETSHVINRGDDFDNGYHHVVGAAYRRETEGVMTFANGLASPDAIRVSIAESNILVLRYAPR